MSIITEREKSDSIKTDIYTMDDYNDELKILLKTLEKAASESRLEKLNLEYDIVEKKQREQIKNKNMINIKRKYYVYFIALCYTFTILSFTMWLIVPVPLNYIISILIWIPMVMGIYIYVTNKRSNRNRA